jgi:hypothetical protein
MKSILRIVILCLVALGITGGLIWGFRSGRTEQAAEAESDAPIEAPSRAMQEADKTVLVFDEQAQRANGIGVAMLSAERRSVETQANGVVLQLQPLLDLKSSYDTGQMNLAKAHAAAQASQIEYARLRQLNSGGVNVAVKTVEMASATAESDAATLKNAEQSLAVLKDSMELRWGTTVAHWLEQDSPQLDAMLRQREYLIQITTFGAYNHVAPLRAIAELPDGTHASARLISALPQIDPRLQAPAFLYALPAHPSLVPGINLSVFLSAGPPHSGTIVPYSAVVWWQGKAWCYVEEQPNKFTREAVSTANPTPAGWFVSEGVAAGARVVTKGAQTLLSEEFRSQIQTDED